MITAPPEPPVQPVAPPSPRRPWRALAGVTAALLLGVGALGAYGAVRQGPPELAQLPTSLGPAPTLTPARAVWQQGQLRRGDVRFACPKGSTPTARVDRAPGLFSEVVGCQAPQVSGRTVGSPGSVLLVGVVPTSAQVPDDPARTARALLVELVRRLEKLDRPSDVIRLGEVAVEPDTIAGTAGWRAERTVTVDDGGQRHDTARLWFAQAPDGDTWALFRLDVEGTTPTARQALDDAQASFSLS